MQTQYILICFHMRGKYAWQVTLDSLDDVKHALKTLARYNVSYPVELTRIS